MGTMGLVLQYPMTRGALLRRRLVEEHRPAVDLAHQLVAVRALHVGVYALQRERSAAVVIEERRLPPVAVVAICTCGPIILRELLAVRIVVALLALFRRGLEVDVNHGPFEIWRLVAIDARGGAMRTQQRKTCLRVIELG